MEPQENQQDLSPEMTPEEAKASLGIATMLQQQHLDSQMPPESSEGAENTQSGEKQQIDPEALKEEISGDLMKEVKKMIKEEIGGIKDMIKEALKEDGNKE